jgi:DNA modification methylase
MIEEMLNRVTCGDCIDVMANMPARSVDFVLTDPPYLVRYHDRSGRRVINDDNDAWLKPAFRQIHRVLKPDAFCVSFSRLEQNGFIHDRVARSRVSHRRSHRLSQTVCVEGPAPAVSA